ncbi:MAG: RNA-directed DNA polymerase [Acidobacteriota bacterium]|nr:RNA-directed DNA polymerase [Acidobacteriota bacterium]
MSFEVEKHWKKLSAFCRQSRIALSTPTLSDTRALGTRRALADQPVYRAEQSVGKRYLLKTDLARFYPSIYTHSIGWALHGKKIARENRELFGNKLDERVRNTQDKQTGGIPIGPDTSFLIGEVIGAALDVRLQAQIKKLRGTRFIDDYFLYFETSSEAERALATLHQAAKEFELEVNDPKTEIIALPESFEPAWKAELRAMEIRSKGAPQITDLMALFNRAFELVPEFPADSVLTYAAKQVLSSEIDPDNWGVCESLLLRSVTAEPTMMPALIEIVRKNGDAIKDKKALATTVVSLCDYHGPLQQGYEVAWALWLAKELEVKVPLRAARAVVELDDDIVALVALDLLDSGLFPTVEMSLWRSHMNGKALYSEHWLLAYEAYEHGWLHGRRGDYVDADSFFQILRKHQVRFYRSQATTLPEPSPYLE